MLSRLTNQKNENDPLQQKILSSEEKSLNLTWNTFMNASFDTSGNTKSKESERLFRGVTIGCKADLFDPHMHCYRRIDLM